MKAKPFGGKNALDYAALFLRIGFGFFIMTHGWAKLSKAFTGDFHFADPIGIGPAASLWLAGSAEFFGGLLVFLGLFIRVALIPLLFTLIVAGFIQHAGSPWLERELAMIYLAAFLALWFTGSGKFSIDGLR